MTIESLQTWKDELALLPQTEDSSWTDNLANFYSDMIQNIEPSGLTDPGFIFNFDKSTFKSGLSSIGPTEIAAAGALLFATAWELAITSTTVTINPGAFIGTQTPPTTFSSVISSIIDAPSILLGKNKIIELSSSIPVDDPNDSIFAEKFRDATLLLTITVTGLDSQSPPTGPLPLTATAVGLV